jgi:hypothetical protein
MREADIVADRHPEPAPWQINGQSLAARRIGARFPPAFAIGQVDIIQMHLVVTGGNVAVGPEHIGAVGDLVADFDGQRADMDMQLLLARQIAQSRQHAVALLGYQRAAQPVAAAVDRVRHFRCLDIDSPVGGRFADGFDRKIGIGQRVGARTHLDAGREEGGFCHDRDLIPPVKRRVCLHLRAHANRHNRRHGAR